MLADGTRLAAGAVVNAAGTAAARLTPGVPIRPRKGHLAITDRYPGFLRHQLIELGYIKSCRRRGDRVGGLQRPAAAHGPIADRLVAAV